MRAPTSQRAAAQRPVSSRPLTDPRSPRVTADRGRRAQRSPPSTMLISMSGARDRAAAVLTPGWSWSRAAAAGLVGAVLVAIPTDLVDTGWFVRMTPPRAWDYPLAALTVLLAAVAAGLGSRRAARPGDSSGIGSGPWAGLGSAALAVGCPLCNKVVVAALGASGALEIWAPLQPVLGGVTVLLLGFAVVLRWHVAAAGARDCPPCRSAHPTAAGGPHSAAAEPAGHHYGGGGDLAPETTVVSGARSR